MRGNTPGGRVELRPGTPRRLKMAPPDRIASNASGGGSRFAGPGTGGSFSWDARVPGGRQVGSRLVPFSPQTDAVLRRTYGPLYGGLGVMTPAKRAWSPWRIAALVGGGVAAALSYRKNRSLLWAAAAWLVWPASLPYYLITGKD